MIDKSRRVPESPSLLPLRIGVHDLDAISGDRVHHIVGSEGAPVDIILHYSQPALDGIVCNSMENKIREDNITARTSII